MPKVSESIDIKANAKECYAVIWDYTKYPEFVTGVSSIKVKKKKKDQLEVVFGVNLIKQVVYTVAVTGTPHERVDWDLLEGSAFKKIVGSWEFTQKKKGVTKATYSLDLDFSFFVPDAIAKPVIASTLPSMLKSFKARIEARQP